MKKLNRKRSKILKNNPAKLFFFAYIITILIGGFLLSLPIASAKGEFTNPLDTTFTATSAVCVTGLVTHVTSSHWSIFGKVVIILLIQLGGLGVVTAVGALGLIINRKFSVKDRLYIAEEKNADSIHGMVKLIKYVLGATFLIEGIGALILSFRFIPDYGFVRGLGYSVFHAISAFCNAGFDLIGEYSLAPYAQNPHISFTIAGLIVLAGLGFTVYKDVLQHKKFRKFKLHTKIVLVTTAVFIIVPAILFLIIEWGNPKTLGPMTVGGKLVASIFQSVTPRTAGFFTIDQAGLRNSSLLITIFLMFVGGAPAGTAGGLKITTLFSLVAAARSNLRKEKDVTIFNRRIPKDIVEKSLTITIVSLVWIFVALIIMTFTDGDNSIVNLLYEIISAYGTVGLTRGITPSLSAIGKLIIMFTMVFGKIGPIAMVYVFSNRSSSNTFREAEENILVG